MKTQGPGCHRGLERWCGPGDHRRWAGGPAPAAGAGRPGYGGSVDDKGSRIIALEDRYGSGLYSKQPLVLVRGEGARLWDADGRRVYRLHRRPRCGERGPRQPGGGPGHHRPGAAAAGLLQWFLQRPARGAAGRAGAHRASGHGDGPFSATRGPRRWRRRSSSPG